MSINVGDVIYANNMAGDSGNISASYPDAAMRGSTEFYTFGNNINVSLYCNWFGHVLYIYVDQYSNGQWVQLAKFESGGFQGAVSGIQTLGVGLHRIHQFAVPSEGDSSMSWSFWHLRSSNVPRTKGNKMRTLASDFSGYEAAGTSKITAALVNAGRVCTY